MTDKNKTGVREQVEGRSRTFSYIVFAVTACAAVTSSPTNGLAAYWNFRNGDWPFRVEIHDNGEISINDDGVNFFGTTDTSTFHLVELDGEPITRRFGQSMRTLVTLNELSDRDDVWYAIGSSDYHFAGAYEASDGESDLRAGICGWRACEWTAQSMPYAFLGKEFFLHFDGYGDRLLASAWIPGDPSSLVQHEYMYQMFPTQPAIALRGEATIHEMWIASEPMTVPCQVAGDFNCDGTLDVEDIDLLSENINEHRREFDLNNDNDVDLADHDLWVKEYKATWYGDANLDGEFNSTDLVRVFEAGQYEDEIDENSSWATGDWTADGEFTTSDLVRAFTDGGYELGPRAAAQAVPEPSAATLLLVAIAGTMTFTRQRKMTP